MVRLHRGESLEFLGFTFRYDRDLHGRVQTYLNVTPSKKSMKKARESIRAKTGPEKCYKPAPEVVEDLNGFLRGWSKYFQFGYPRKAFRDISHYTRQRVVKHQPTQPEKIPPSERAEPLPISPATGTDTP